MNTIPCRETLTMKSENGRPMLRKVFPIVVAILGIGGCVGFGDKEQITKITLMDAHRFHTFVRANLPPNTSLGMLGFRLRKEASGFDYGDETDKVGTWEITDEDDAVLLRLRLAKGEKHDRTSIRWEDYRVEVIYSSKKIEAERILERIRQVTARVSQGAMPHNSHESKGSRLPNAPNEYEPAPL
jgi:hypothetical protein